MAISRNLADLPPIETWRAGLIAVLMGNLSHLLYYIRGHREPQSPAITVVHLSMLPILVGAFVVTRGLSFASVLVAATVWASYHMGLFASILVYRVFFHPLQHFPGPFWSKVSKAQNILLAQGGKLHEHHTRWARKYGNFVRVAPNEVLLTSVDAIQIIHGPRSTATKQHTQYDYVHYHGVYNINAIHDRAEHRCRRQVWELALSTKNMETYEQYAREVTHSWLDKLSSSASHQEPLDISLYMHLVPFDNMTKMGFSRNFETVRSGTENRMLHLMEVTFAKLARTAHSSWPLFLLKCLGGSEGGQFDALAREAVDKREEEDSNGRLDLMRYFLEDFRSEKPKAFTDRDIVYTDAQAIMIGGTDTLAALLSHSFYYLAKDPSMRQRLREELTPVFGKTIHEEFVHNDLSGLALLKSVISETLRMHSPACNNPPRRTTEDTLIDGVVVPRDTTVYVGIHSIHRSSQYFVCPDKWVPERWTSQPGLILDKRAYHPFIVGPFNCVGKRIALIVARLVLSYTVLHYDFEFAPGEDGSKILKDGRNQIILKPGKLDLVFNKPTLP